MSSSAAAANSHFLLCWLFGAAWCCWVKIKCIVCVHGNVLMSFIFGAQWSFVIRSRNCLSGLLVHPQKWLHLILALGAQWQHSQRVSLNFPFGNVYFSFNWKCTDLGLLTTHSFPPLTCAPQPVPSGKNPPSVLYLTSVVFAQYVSLVQTPENKFSQQIVLIITRYYHWASKTTWFWGFLFNHLSPTCDRHKHRFISKSCWL